MIQISRWSVIFAENGYRPRIKFQGSRFAIKL
jgi:hypothetical protein